SDLMVRYDRELRALEGLGLSDIEMDGVIALLSDYVHGAAREAVAMADAAADSGRTDQEWWEQHAPELERIADPSVYPVAARVGTAVGERYGASHDPAADFDFGLKLVLDGVAALLESRARPCAAREVKTAGRWSGARSPGPGGRRRWIAPLPAGRRAGAGGPVPEGADEDHRGERRRPDRGGRMSRWPGHRANGNGETPATEPMPASRRPAGAGASPRRADTATAAAYAVSRQESGTSAGAVAEPLIAQGANDAPFARCPICNFHAAVRGLPSAPGSGADRPAHGPRRPGRRPGRGGHSSRISASIRSAAYPAPPLPRSSAPISASRAATRGEEVSSSSAARSRSAVASPVSMRRATPWSCSASALANWSANCGTAIIGTPQYSPSLEPPMPACVTNAEACFRIASCGTQRCTSVLSGTGPSAPRSTALPTCRTTCQSGRPPKARRQAR